MARMIPSGFPEGASPNERVVFDLLRNAPGTETWSVLHQVEIASHITQVSGEADFIVVIPYVGVVFLEVKGHVTYENGEWSFGGDKKKRSPFVQAKEAKFSVLNWLKDQDYLGLDFPFCSGCVFVTTRWDGEVVDFHRHQLIDSRSIDIQKPSLFTEAILNLVEKEVDRWSNLDKSPNVDQEYFSVEDANRLVDVLRPAIHSPKSLAPLIWCQIDQFTGEQIGALSCTSTHRQVLFTGLAGTGKSVLAVTAASQISQRGESVLVACFNTLVHDKLKQALKLPGIKVSTVSKLAYDTVGEKRAQQILESYANAEAWDMIAKEAEQAALAMSDAEKFDCLIVDEAQDIMKERILPFIFSFLKGGAQDGRWIFFADRHQWIFKGKDISLEKFIEDHPKSFVRQLHANCRNTQRIAEFANTYSELKLPDAYDPVLVKNQDKPDHPRPTLNYYADDDQQVKAVKACLAQLFEDGFQPRDIVVLSRKASGSCADKLCSQGYPISKYQLSGDSANEVRFTTVQAFKGLESIAVVLTDIELPPNAEGWMPIWSLFYTCVTRAVYRLDCFAHESTKEEFIGLALRR